MPIDPDPEQTIRDFANPATMVGLDIRQLCLHILREIEDTYDIRFMRLQALGEKIYGLVEQFDAVRTERLKLLAEQLIEMDRTTVKPVNIAFEELLRGNTTAANK